MTPEEFKSLWVATDDPFVPSPLVCFPQGAVSRRRLSPEDKRFLTSIGLPESAAPFLSFGSKHVIDMPVAASVFGRKHNEDQFSTIGFNGSGDPICIDESSESRIVYLNHDDNFSVNFMNSSIARLAYSLLAFREVVRETNRIGGTGAFLERRIPLEVADRFITNMEEVDAMAIAPGSFWLTEVSARA